MEDKKPFKRRTYFIPQSSQPHMILGIQVIYLLLVLFSGVIFYLVANQDLGDTYLAAHLKIENTMEILLPSLIALNVGGLIVATIVSVFFTHRITGPVYRLARIMRELGDGNLTNYAYFRDDDELKELSGAFDHMVLDLNRRLYGLRARTDALIQAVSKMPAGSEVQGMAQEANQLMAELAHFQLLPRERLNGSKG